MGLFSFLIENRNGELIDFASGLYDLKLNQIAAKELAVEKCIDLISKAIARLEFKVYENVNGKINSIKNNVYYQLNIRPNDNADGTTFWKDVIRKLIKDKEALVVIMGSKLYLADKFDKSNDVIYSKTFKNVYVKTLNNDTSYKLNKNFKMDDVFYFSLGESEISRLIDNFFIDYGKLIAFASLDFKLKNSKKIRVKFPGNNPNVISNDGTGEKKFTTKEYLDLIAKDLFSDDPALISIPGNIELTNLMGDNAKTSEDYRKLIEGAFNTVASAFNIPIDIMLGNKTDKSTSTTDLVTNAYLPFIEIIEDGVNSKIVTKEEYLNGSKVRIDRTKLQHVSIIDISKDSEALFRIGFSHNDIREIGGLEPINEPWANEHYVTKNYTSEKGGENK